ncbi:hypothetical protein DACRYDRAFT_12869 [Dacryopinax primogenitus]|uniref:Major facilitator superfamily (MFS) profile domain-containing protein n=1 Tax=Dacryopinax primogenitus (strain DJM 731) TaxID=1858805 RepID=M5G770_DACPD|nr:uncharacterized protein DACRYDRAFT_12869 [Dacryopinax primogenitus]EJU06086.1 hypothetical protein DACRYDRAFT_12869 [Dacryopinax primogenitus]
MQQVKDSQLELVITSSRLNRLTKEANVQKNGTDASIMMVPAQGSFDLSEEVHYLTGLKVFLASSLWIPVSAMVISLFLVVLDQTIIATAIPCIAFDFNALNLIMWIVSAYLITQAGLLMLYGQVLLIAPTKWVYITAITLFEIGSLICGVSPNVNVLIFGRAFAGIGAAGIIVSILNKGSKSCPSNSIPSYLACSEQSLP